MEENTTESEDHNVRLTGNLEFRILPELNLITQYTYQTRKGERYAYQSSRTQAGSGYWGDQKGFGRKTHSKTDSKELEIRLSYMKDFGENHKLTAMLASNYTTRNRSITRYHALISRMTTYRTQYGKELIPINTGR